MCKLASCLCLIRVGHGYRANTFTSMLNKKYILNWGMAWTWLGHGLDTGEIFLKKKKEKKSLLTTKHNLKHQLGFEFLKFRSISLFLALKSQRFLISLADLQLVFTEPASLVLLC